MRSSPLDRFQRADAVFDAVLDLPPDEQAAYVDRACGDDAELHAEVLALLRAHHRAGSFLDAPAARVAALLDERPALLAGPAPERVGPFRIVRAIGQGGMGQVFLGERADGQFEQRVAIKLIRHGTPGLVRRFLEERRILALLEHPRIARLIDGGITEGGLPYFAMELVEGEPIDRHCASRDLPLDERLRLVVDVCDAVSYAHHHLVIHRDLKPSNILVTADGQVKLLDFGIAKLLREQEAGDATRTELRAMTPEFAAPEQVRGEPVSTATDVYALGVLLYMLLAGERPYELRGASPAEIERIVCGQEPARPSTRAPAALRRRLRGDLDLIVMTALRKEPERRYQSPGALAEDLQRFREGRPILARRDSAPYRVGKFVGRHRAGVAAAALLVLALAGAASRERVLRTRAELEARKAREVEDFLVGVFDVADPLAPEERDGGSVTARELLDRGASRIDSTLAGQPEVQAELRTVLGRVYASLGLYDRATPLLRRSLEQREALRGRSDPGVAATMDLLGMSLVRQDRLDEAEPLLREALARRRLLLGGRDTATARSLEHLATMLEERETREDLDAAEPLYREALEIRRAALGDTAAEVAVTIGNLGLLHHRRGEHAAAESLHRRALALQRRGLGEDHPLTAATMQNLAQTLQARGDLREAETFYRRSLAAKRRALGDTHPSVTIGLNNLGVLLRGQGRLEEAESLTREALALDRRIFGERHSFVAQSLGNLGNTLAGQGKFAEADSLMAEATAMNRALFGERHGAIASNLGFRAQIRYQLGDDAGALALMRESQAQFLALLGEEHLSTTVTAGNLGRLLVETGRPAEAEPILRAALSRLDSANRGHRTHLLAAQRSLGHALAARGRFAEALPLLERTVAMSLEAFGDTSARTAYAQLTYGRALLARGRAAAAEPLLRAADATLRRHRAAQPRLAAEAAEAVGRLRAMRNEE